MTEQERKASDDYISRTTPFDDLAQYSQKIDTFFGWVLKDMIIDQWIALPLPNTVRYGQMIFCINEWRLSTYQADGIQILVDNKELPTKMKKTVFEAS